MIGGRSKKILGYLKKSILNPEPSPSDDRLCIRLLLKPVIYDLYAIWVQLRDQRRMNNIVAPDTDQISDADVSIRHNLNEIATKVVTTTRRVEPAYQIATVPWRDLSKEKLLIIGCRNVMELHQAWMLGFRWTNIFGGDLFSTNPKILELNMEDMPEIADESFNVVTMVNTLAYTTQPEKAFAEVSRILAPGGRFVFNYSFPKIPIHALSDFSGDKLPDQRHVTEEAVHNMFEDAGFRKYFYSKPGKKKKSDGNVLDPTWFGLEKLAAFE